MCPWPVFKYLYPAGVTVLLAVLDGAGVGHAALAFNTTPPLSRQNCFFRHHSLKTFAREKPASER